MASRRNLTILDAYGRPVPRAASPLSGGWSPGGYQGAGWSRDRGQIQYWTGDSKQELTRYTRGEINRKALWLFKNVGMVRGVWNDFVKYVVGVGIFPFAETGEEEIDEAYDEYYLEWAKVQDAGGRLTQWEKQRVRTGAKFLSGEIFTQLMESPSGFPQTQLIREHHCKGGDDDRFTHGVRLGRANRALAYRFEDADGNEKIRPASAIIHSFLPVLGDEVRQVSCLHGAVLHLQDVLEILAYEKVAVKDHSRIARVRTYQDSGAMDEDLEPESGERWFKADNEKTGEQAANITLEQVFGGEVVRLAAGEKLESFASSRPSPAFTGFLDYLGRDIYAGTGWRYEFSWHPEGIGSAAQRAVLDSIEKTVQIWQDSEIRDTARERAFVIARGIARGDLPFHPRWWKADYLPSAPKPTIDKGRDGREDRENLKLGLDTYKNLYGRRGRYYKKELRQAAREALFIDELAEEMGIDRSRIQQLAPNDAGNAAGDRPDREEEAASEDLAQRIDDALAATRNHS